MKFLFALDVDPVIFLHKSEDEIQLFFLFLLLLPALSFFYPRE